jgi:hypothetical protein
VNVANSESAPRTRVLAVVNKWWECDPALNAVLHQKARPRELSWPSALRHPRKRPDQLNLPGEDPTPHPRAVIDLTHVSVEMWCISDLLEHLKDTPENQSSSERKAEQLPKMFVGDVPQLVIAIGTAGYPADVDLNGSVVVGTGIFMHDARPAGTAKENSHSKFADDRLGRFLPSRLSRDQFRTLIPSSEAVEPRLLPTPLASAPQRFLLAAHHYNAIGTTNVTDYADYDWADHESLEKFSKRVPDGVAASLETTHGLIRLQSEAPFVFISGITDRVGRFHLEVTPREYAQNAVAAHNAGVVLGWMLPKIDLLFTPKPPVRA